jgi:Uma2 family endonuclease
MATTTGLTIDDFEQLPDALAHNHELVDGELVDVSGNNYAHNRLRDALVKVLRTFVEDHGLGRIVTEQEYEFEDNAHGPDVTFFATEKVPLVNLDLRVQRFVPDLAIEIISPNDKFSAVRAKIERYRRCGVKEVFVFSRQPVEVYVYSDRPTVILAESDDFRPQQIPGFSIRISDLFAMI